MSVSAEATAKPARLPSREDGPRSGRARASAGPGALVFTLGGHAALTRLG